jgi:transposase
MDAPLDLYRASREDLIAVIGRLREQVAEQDQEITRLRAELATQQAAMVQVQERLGALLTRLEPAADDDPPPRSTTMPGLKSARRRSPVPVPRARKRRAHGYGRKRLPATARQVHAYAHCPQCQTVLRGGTARHRREVIELLPARVEVTEHVYLERRCPRCRGRWQPGPALAGVVVGQRRLGVGLLSLIATLREELRLPLRSIQWYLEAVHGLHLSVGAITDALTTVAVRAEGVVAGLWEAIRASPVLHVDETGWRQDGDNGYVWTFATPSAQVFVRGSRERAMLTAAIGEEYDGVLVSDFYTAYTGYAGRHQYCWAHLLRDVDDLVGQHPDNDTVRGWAAGVHGLYRRAVTYAAAPDPVRRRHRQACEAELGALCAPYLGVVEAPQRGLCARISKHLSELFVFVEDPAVPATNNAAERSLRHLVTSRKISGGTRSPAGTATKMTLATLFGTWRLHGLNPLDKCRALLTSPQI